MTTHKYKPSDIDYALDYLKGNDYDRYLIVRMVRDDNVQIGLLALYCLNAELEKTRWIVTDTTIGLIRLQWWRDAIDKIYSKKAIDDHPVMRLLNEIIYLHDVPQSVFEGMVNSREGDLYPNNINSIDDLIKHFQDVTKPMTEFMCDYLCPTYKVNIKKHVTDSVVYELSKYALSANWFEHGAFPLHLGRDAGQEAKDRALAMIEEEDNYRPLAENFFAKDNLKYDVNAQSRANIPLNRKPWRLLKLLWWHYFR